MATKKVNKATEPDNLFDKFMRTTQYATDLDRYSDFRSLFLDTEQGKRVFNESRSRCKRNTDSNGRTKDGLGHPQAYNDRATSAPT